MQEVRSCTGKTFTIESTYCTLIIGTKELAGVSDDLSHILKNWEYNPDKPVRIITADDGREVLQVRQPLGVEQYELDGRPDGGRPEGEETFLSVIEKRLSNHILQHANDSEFSISQEDLLNLQNEGILFYYRYLQLFQVGDFERTVRDTAHNLNICERIEKYCQESEDKNTILQYKPYILRMHAIAEAMISLHKNLNTVAKDTLETAIAMINNMQDIDTPAFKFEKIRSLSYLKSALKQIDDSDSTPTDKLKVELDAAVADEDYERAALLRDKIKEIKDLPD